MSADLINDRQVEPAEALNKMRDIAALWSVGEVLYAELVDAANDLLVTGQVCISVAELSGVKKWYREVEVAQLLEDALDDVGLDFYPKGSLEGREAALRIMAGRALAGVELPRDLAVWAYSQFGDEGFDLLGSLADLGCTYSNIEDIVITEQELNAEILSEARRIVGSTWSTPANVV